MLRAIKLSVVPVLFLISLVTILVAIFYPTLLQNSLTPKGYTYFFGSGYLPDYYQYLSWIKSGMLGYPLVVSRLTELHEMPVIIHEVFVVTGWIAGLLHLSPYVAYFFLRIFSVVVFFLSVYALMCSITDKPMHRMILWSSFMLSAPWFVWKQGVPQIPIAWTTSFDPFGKFVLPPHHLLGLTLIIWLFLFSKSYMDTTIRPLGRLIFWGVPTLIGILNPGFLLIILIVSAMEIGVVVLSMIVRLIQKKSLVQEHDIRSLSMHGGLILATLPMLGYSQYLFSHTDPWKFMYELMRNFRPPVTFREYLLALGPMLPLSVLGYVVALMYPSSKKTLLRSLFWWGVIPLCFFPLVGTLLPMSESRLFQVYQYIPLSFVGGIGITGILMYIHNILPTKIVISISTGIIVVAACYVIPAMSVTAKTAVVSAQNQQARNYALYATDDMMAAYRFLDAKHDDSVVVAGEMVSELIPVLTPHRTILGRDDTIRHYYERRAEIFDFLNGKLSKSDVKKFIENYHVRYVLTGIDATPFSNLPYGSYGLFTQVFSQGGVAVHEVL
jgi:hypothetical protein